MFISANPDDDFQTEWEATANHWYKQAKAYERDLKNLHKEYARLLGETEKLICTVSDLEYELKERS